jgi:transposase
LSREELLALVAAQAQVIEQLTARVAELERQLGRNSGNSSMPPSTDDLPGRTPPVDKPQLGKGSKRRQGKQRGAPGANLAWSANPNETVPHYPRGHCGCGADLGAATDLGVAVSHQEHDIPQVSAIVRQHDRHRVRCGCGAEHVAAVPDGVANAPVSYGVNLQTLCVLLLVVHALPVHRCAQLIAAITGASPSPGFVHNMLKRAFTALGEVDARIRTLVTLAYAVCSDETPLRVGPKKMRRYLLVACNDLYTYYMLGDRSMDTFKAFLLPELTGVIVHDRYTVYDSDQITRARVDNGLAALVHQLCTAHLLRDLAAVAETYPDEHWPIQIADALRGLIHAANTARDAGADNIDPAVQDKLITLFRQGVLVGLKDIPRVEGSGKQPDYRLLLEVLHRREDDVLRFAHDLRVPPTSNTAERDLRPSKTQQKISGRLRSETVTTYRYRIASYTSTATKHGIEVFQALRSLLKGHPWMPALPATT